MLLVLNDKALTPSASRREQGADPADIEGKSSQLSNLIIPYLRLGTGVS